MSHWQLWRKDLMMVTFFLSLSIVLTTLNQTFVSHTLWWGYMWSTLKQGSMSRNPTGKYIFKLILINDSRFLCNKRVQIMVTATYRISLSWIINIVNIVEPRLFLKNLSINLYLQNTDTFIIHVHVEYVGTLLLYFVVRVLCMSMTYVQQVREVPGVWKWVVHNYRPIVS